MLSGIYERPLVLHGCLTVISPISASLVKGCILSWFPEPFLLISKDISKYQHLVSFGVCFSLPLLCVRQRKTERRKTPSSIESNIPNITMWVVGTFQITVRKWHVLTISTTCNHSKWQTVQSQYILLEIDIITGKFRCVRLPCYFHTFIIYRELFFLYVTFRKDCRKLCYEEELSILNKLKVSLKMSSWVREEREWNYRLQIICLGLSNPYSYWGS